MMETGVLPLIAGMDYLRDADWQPVRATRAGAQRIADRMAQKARLRDRGFGWTGTVTETNRCYRLALAGMKERE